MSVEHLALTGGHHGLGDINHRALRNAIGNCLANDPNMVIGSGTTSAIDYDAFDYTIGGRWYEQVAGTDEALTVLDYYGSTSTQAAGTTCWYAIVIDAAGTEYAIKGKDDETTRPPAIPDGYALMGLIKIVTVGVTFTIGTTGFDASGVTDTFYSYRHLPVTLP